MTTSDTVIEKKQVTDNALKEPSKYKVIAINDDVTPIDFVVMLLISVFKHDDSSALQLTLEIHNSGSAVVGVYSYEVAEQKISDAIDLAREHGYPLVLKAEEA